MLLTPELTQGADKTVLMDGRIEESSVGACDAVAPRARALPPARRKSRTSADRRVRRERCGARIAQSHRT